MLLATWYGFHKWVEGKERPVSLHDPRWQQNLPFSCWDTQMQETHVICGKPLWFPAWLPCHLRWRFVHLLNHSRVSGTSTEGQALLCAGDDNGGNKRQTSLSSWRSHSGISYIRWWEKLRGNEAEVGFRERWSENGELEFRWSGPGRRKWHPKKALEGVTGISSPPPGHSALFPSPLPGTLA